MNRIRAIFLILAILLMQHSTFESAAQHHTPANPRDDHGIVLFYTMEIPADELGGIKNQNLYGGEMIAFWHEVEPEDGKYDWSRIDRDIETWHRAGKKLDIRLSTTHDSPNRTPAWVFQNYQVRRVGRGFWCDFEKDALHYTIGAQAKVISQSGGVISGEKALEANAADTPFLVISGDGVIRPGAEYSVQCDYRTTGDAELNIRVVSSGKGILQDKSFPASDSVRIATLEFDPGDVDDARIEWYVSGSGSVILDNVNVIRVQEVLPTEEWKPGDDGAWRVIDGDVQGGSLGGSADGGEKILLRNNPRLLPVLEGDSLHAVISARSTGKAEVVLRTVADELNGRAIVERRVTIDSDEMRSYSFFTPHAPPEYLDEGDCHLELVVESGSVEIESVSWRRFSDRVTVFPDYFSDDLRMLWERLVTAFAERYKDHPALGAISIGGFGRWEEVMLDEDQKGVLDEQWYARGYTREKYLEQIEWSMDMHQRLMPGHPLRICLAYGMEYSGDVDWTYHRVAQAAARRSIGLKQNGLSEKYDTWNDNTNTSYIFNRYRFRDDVTLTHETGGQIYRNLYDAHGYPHSILNRSSLNHAEYVFLYLPDIFVRNVNKYFRHYLDGVRSGTVPVFFSWLGDYSLINEHSDRPVSYQNQWLGIRQFQAPNASVIYTVRNGERVAQTTPENRRIVFDVDDRYQYNGMFGTVLTIDYLDDGTDPFKVSVFDNSSGDWQDLGTVQRTNTGRFEKVSFYDGDWCNSARNSGEDVHIDVVLENLGDTPLAVRNTEIQFVPAGDYETVLLDQNEPVDDAQLAEKTLSRLIEIPKSDFTSVLVEIPVYSPDLDDNNVVVSIYGMTNAKTGSEVMLARKEYYMPADGDWVPVYFAPRTGLVQLRVEMVTTLGRAGWKRGRDGEFAYRLSTYAFERSITAPASWKTLNQGEEIDIEFAAPHPFTAVALSVKEGDANKLPHMEDHPSRFEVSVRRKLAGGSVSAPIAEVKNLSVTDANPAIMAITPQPAGRFEITVRSHWGTTAVGIDADGAAAVKPLAMKSRMAPRPPRDHRPGREIASWTFGEESPWEAGENIQPSGPGKLAITGYEPTLYSPKGLGLNTHFSQFFTLRMKNDSPARMARLFWAADGQEFSAERSVLIPILSYDIAMRDYTFPVGYEDEWTGIVDRFMLQPICGSIDVGFVTIEEIALTEQLLYTDLNFTRPLDMLSPIQDISASVKTDQGLLVTVDGPSPILRMPACEFNVEAESGQVLQLELQNMSSATSARIHWWTLDRPELKRKALTEVTDLVASIPVPANMSAPGAFTVDLSALEGWTGQVVALSLSPAVDAKPGEQVLLKSMKIYKQEAAEAN